LIEIDTDDIRILILTANNNFYGMKFEKRWGTIVIGI